MLLGHGENFLVGFIITREAHRRHHSFQTGKDHDAFEEVSLLALALLLRVKRHVGGIHGFHDKRRTWLRQAANGDRDVTGKNSRRAPLLLACAEDCESSDRPEASEQQNFFSCFASALPIGERKWGTAE
jgi:hypothetical protein